MNSIRYSRKGRAFQAKEQHVQKTWDGKKLSKFNKRKKAKVSGTSKARRVMEDEDINVSSILLIFLC